MPLPFGATITPWGAGTIGLGLGNILMNLLADKRSDNFRQDYRANYPNYPGDPLADILNNPLINWQNLLSKTPYLKGTLMNQGIDPNLIQGSRRIGGYGRPTSSFNPIIGERMPNLNFSYPQNFIPFNPAFTINQAIPSLFKPDQGFQMQSGGFGTSPLINAPNPQPQIKLEDLLATLSTGK